MRYLIILSLLLMCGCPNPDTRYFTQKKPRNEDLFGTYVPTAETIRWVKQKGKYPEAETSIVLSEDGSFRMVNMPDWWITPFGKPKGGFDCGVGQWKPVKQQEWWVVQLDFKSRKEFTSDPAATGLLTSVQIVGESAPYQLWFYVGDPDSGDVMILEKKREGSGGK